MCEQLDRRIPAVMIAASFKRTCLYVADLLCVIDFLSFRYLSVPVAFSVLLLGFYLQKITHCLSLFLRHLPQFSLPVHPGMFLLTIRLDLPRLYPKRNLLHLLKCLPGPAPAGVPP